MAKIGSVGYKLPKYNIDQQKVKELVQHIFPRERAVDKLKTVFENAKVDNRQFVVNEKWFLEDHTFEKKNNLYIQYAKKLSVEAVDYCLSNELFLKEPIPYEAIDAIFYISSTGISTPSMDAYIFNERPFREDIIRVPLWGLGCAGGAVGLSRASDYLKAHPSHTVLVVCCELCSLTFQKSDVRMSNLVGTAIFGDGVSAVVLAGDQSTSLSHFKNDNLSIKKTSSFTQKESLSIMGWDIKETGLQVIFSKRIPTLVKTLWKDHVDTFLNTLEFSVDDIDTFIAHPGGRKVLEEMEQALMIKEEKLKHSYSILRDHGNMSSATVFYVLHEWLQKSTAQIGSKNILCALGPGFSSELLLLEWTT